MKGALQRWVQRWDARSFVSEFMLDDSDKEILWCRAPVCDPYETEGFTRVVFAALRSSPASMRTQFTRRPRWNKSSATPPIIEARLAVWLLSLCKLARAALLLSLPRTLAHCHLVALFARLGLRLTSEEKRRLQGFLEAKVCLQHGMLALACAGHQTDERLQKRDPPAGSRAGRLCGVPRQLRRRRPLEHSVPLRSAAPNPHLAFYPKVHALLQPRRCRYSSDEDPDRSTRSLNSSSVYSPNQRGASLSDVRHAPQLARRCCQSRRRCGSAPMGLFREAL